ncbi:hypothetical protein HanXRQr2_Chr10g0449021 [Helianthus annuus]|uniref:Uncharacterized protein n=1 Tax=Helianthus annuus TaxID=4232 RepID=A0A251SA56_HELAN|nr:hypothetical protein HanXRQr2_Chr10g0449021 [Helianthus annuus]KAJ0514401.1 hypothetical protein HanHA300_Chr10g0369141 [Helianthus annuus]KAJ0522580.1 hypothetical protein HanIR_Chr10g0484141 [Helianthus annuus]KAJ0903662.1 hypothetical protein HanPSC8_Chr07g0272561 [Helianthus annuus]
MNPMSLNRLSIVLSDYGFFTRTLEDAEFIMIKDDEYLLIMNFQAKPADKDKHNV